MEEQDWAQVVAAATRAPSIHNTQPWRFAASPDRLDVFLDPERALPVLDPTCRQQVISCGSRDRVRGRRAGRRGVGHGGGPAARRRTPTTWPRSG